MSIGKVAMGVFTGLLSLHFLGMVIPAIVLGIVGLIATLLFVFL